MKLLDFKSFILESASFKKKEDFSGKKWGAQLMGSRVYNFKSGGQDYILDFTVEQYNPIDKNNFSYVLRFDIRTKKKEEHNGSKGTRFSRRAYPLVLSGQAKCSTSSSRAIRQAFQKHS